MRSATSASSSRSTSRAAVENRFQVEVLEDRTLLAAQILSFDIDASRSFLALTGYFEFGGNAYPFITATGGNSLTSRLDGFLYAEITDDSISFGSGSYLDANELLRGDGLPRRFQPGLPGSENAAAADFAARMDIFGNIANLAIRDFILDVHGGSATLDSEGNFSSKLNFTVDSGTFNFGFVTFRVMVNMEGGKIANSAGQSGNLSFLQGGGVEVTLPIDIIITDVSNLDGIGNVVTSFRFQGRVVGVAQFLDESEPNDTFESAIPISTIQTVTGTTAGAQDVDFFRVDLASAGQLAIRASSQDGTGAPNLALFDANQVLIAQAGGGSTSIILGSLSAGTYYIRVTAGPQSTGVEPYLLQTEFRKPSLAVRGPDDTSDPSRFQQIDISSIFGLQAGSFLFVRDLLAGIPQSPGGGSGVFLSSLRVDASTINTAINAFPMTGTPANVIMAPSTPLSPVSLFVMPAQGATASGLAPLPGFGSNGAKLSARLAMAIEKFGGGDGFRQRSGDSTEVAYPTSEARIEQALGELPGNSLFRVIAPETWKKLVDTLMNMMGGSKEETAPPRGDSSSNGPRFNLDPTAFPEIPATTDVQDDAVDEILAGLAGDAPDDFSASPAAALAALLLARPCRRLDSSNEEDEVSLLERE